MDNSPNKNCLPCKYAPIVFFIILDAIISLGGGAHETIWMLIQLILGSFYLRSYAIQEEREIEPINHKIKLSTVMLCLMTGLVLRHLGLKYMFS